jgi:membrane carboxypeptidase/penicillin-binding protein
MDPESGAVRAMVGSPDYFDTAIDGAVNAAVAPRQTGSAIKPLTYAAAFERGYSPASMFVDVSTTFTTREGQPYTPVNYDYRDHGPVLLREALGSSYNVVAVKLLDRIGIPALADMAGRLGLPELQREDSQGLAMTLGSCEVPLVRLTAAYAAFANGGYRVTPQLIERVEAPGTVLLEPGSGGIPPAGRWWTQRGDF